MTYPARIAIRLGAVTGGISSDDPGVHELVDAVDGVVLEAAGSPADLHLEVVKHQPVVEEKVGGDSRQSRGAPWIERVGIVVAPDGEGAATPGLSWAWATRILVPRVAAPAAPSLRRLRRSSIAE
jgi:hypothetical protein